MDLVGLVAVLGAFAVPLYALRARHEERKRRLELEAGKGGGGEDAEQLREDNRLLRERVENLESIVCSVDFELNQKVAKLIDEHRSSMVIQPGSPGPMQIAAAQANAKAGATPGKPGEAAKPGSTPEALDRTATAHGAKPSFTTTLEPGQVLAQRY